MCGDAMCLYTCALLRTNLFSVTIARVVLTQIRTRYLINEIAFCLRGSVLQSYRLGMLPLPFYGATSPPHVWHEFAPKASTFRMTGFSSHALPRSVPLAMSRPSTVHWWFTYTNISTGHGSISACGHRSGRAASMHGSIQKVTGACQEPAQWGVLTRGASVTNWYWQ